MKKTKKLVWTVALLLIGMLMIFASACTSKKNMVEITFETNGGTAIEAVKVEEGQSYTLPTPVKEGFGFEGWFIDVNFGGNAVTEVTADKDMKFFAKWAQLYKIELDLNGGSLAQTSLYLKEGANVYDFMQNYEPTKGGLVFGAWFNKNAELSKNTRMTKDGLSLKAEYKVQYTVEIWEQNTTLDGYEKVATDKIGYDYIGTTYTSNEKITGFKAVANENAVLQKTLTENASDNILKAYFDREDYIINFKSNNPDGSEGKSQTVNAKYGVEITVPSDYTFEGYCLAGWSTSTTGKVAYKADYIGSVLFNADKEMEADKVSPERNMTLYAVWNKGYEDMFGSNDYIYHLENDSKDIYLSRGKVFFKGEYTVSSKEFMFLDSNDDILLEGKLITDGSYSYRSATREAYSGTLYQAGVGLVKGTTIHFDPFNGIIYSIAGEDGKTTQSNGTYIIDENGYYVANFTDGELNGKTLTFIIGTITVDNVKTAAFQLRNEAEYEMGKLVRFGVNKTALSYFTTAYDITLSGFGIAVFNTGSEKANYNYKLENDILTLMNSSGTTVGVARIMEIEGKKGYMFYTEALDQTFTFDSGATLKLDGLCNLTYVNGSTTLNGYFTTSSSLLGGVIVTCETASKTYKFVINSTSETVGVGDEATTVTKYTVVEKSANYAEYYYQDSEGTYYAPLLVINDEADGIASVYGYTASKTYEKVSSGTFELNAETKLYIYTAKTFFEAEVLTSPIDISTIKSFVFAMDSTSTSYSVSYWYSSTTNEDQTTNYYKTYTSDKNETLTFVGGFAIYTANGSTVTGTYETEDGLTVITATNGYLFVEINEETGKFLTLTSAPYTAYVLLENGTTSKNEYLTYDGKGGATYNVVTLGENNEAVTTTVKGAVTDSKKITSYGAPIMTFTSETQTFDFIELSTSSAVYFAKYNANYNGEYVSNDGILVLDGFGYKASYTDANGTSFEGIYYFAEENLLCFVTNNGNRYFDIKENKSFSAKGLEYGAYILVNNQAINGLFLEFDGYGKLSVYTMEVVEGETKRKDIDTNGTYTLSGDKYTLKYAEQNKEVTLIGKLSTMTISSNTYKTFVVTYEETVQTYVNEKDWSVLILDNLGNAIKYSKEGIKETGTFTIINETLLYYVNADGSDACIYVYNVNKGTATPKKYTAKGYYTKDLDTLLFSEYGFAIFNGETRYYYSIEDSNVTIYLQDSANEEANKYGYVAKNFGNFDAVKEWDGKTYNINTGYAIQFNRVEATAEDYPVLIAEDTKKPLTTLAFTPSGTANFKVTGVVTIDGKNITCYVTRNTLEDGTKEMYVTIGYYRFDITVTYNGEKEDGTSLSTYEVVGMRYIVSAPSYTYLDYYYKIYTLLGSQYASMVKNTVGTVSINNVYDKTGTKIDEYVSGEFGEASKMFDSNGTLVKVEKVPFTFESDIYTVEITAEDNYKYRIYFGLAQHSAFGIYGFQLYGFTRVETLTTANGYTVETERVIATETSVSVGSFNGITISKDGEVIKATNIILADGQINYIVRTVDENGKITATTYYKIKLVEKTDGTVTDGEDKVALYESATVTVETVNTVYTADGKTYVDVSATDGVLLLSLDGSFNFIKSSTYDETTKTYTVTTSKDKTYTIKVEDGVAVVTLVETTSTESTEA